VESDKPSPFADFVSALGGLAFATVVVVLSWRMDRLAHLQVSVYSAPGLVPGLLGAALGLMSVLLMGRALRAGALSSVSLPSFRLIDHWRLLVALGLSLAFALGLVGSGLPFWLAAAIYIAAFVFIFRIADETGQPPWRAAAVAVAYGALMGIVVHYVFEHLFLVRLP
jgi:hypothetical protein